MLVVSRLKSGAGEARDDLDPVTSELRDNRQRIRDSLGSSASLTLARNELQSLRADLSGDPTPGQVACPIRLSA